ncbi:MAG: carbohydrate kinase family protein [Promethearchaeota archaeon]
MTKNFDVICIGAALVDMVAQVARFPENDDEVFVSDLKLLSGGAAANTAYACAKIGLKTAFIGKLGRNDVFGLKIINDFNEVKVYTELIKYSNEHRTGSAYVALNKEGDRRIYAYSGAANYLLKEDIRENELSLANIIYLSSLKNIDPFVKAANIGRDRKIPVILNPGMLIIEQGLINIKILLEKIDILILSQREFKLLFDLKKEDIKLNIVRRKAEELFSLGINGIVITKGNKGALIITPENAEIIPPIKMIKVVDTTGAGDAFSAGFLYGFIQNQSFEFELLKRNVRVGNFIAGKCIEKLGARNGIPEEEEIKLIKLS